jgi:hypothetical protein
MISHIAHCTVCYWTDAKVSQGEAEAAGRQHEEQHHYEMSVVRIIPVGADHPIEIVGSHT